MGIDAIRRMVQRDDQRHLRIGVLQLAGQPVDLRLLEMPAGGHVRVETDDRDCFTLKRPVAVRLGLDVAPVLLAAGGQRRLGRAEVRHPRIERRAGRVVRRVAVVIAWDAQKRHRQVRVRLIELRVPFRLVGIEVDNVADTVDKRR